MAVPLRNQLKRTKSERFTDEYGLEIPAEDLKLQNEIVESVIHLTRHFRSRRGHQPDRTTAPLGYFPIPQAASSDEKEAAYHRNITLYDRVIRELALDRHYDLTPYPAPIVSATQSLERHQNDSLIRSQFNRVGNYGYIFRETVLDTDGTPIDFWAEFRGPSESVEFDLGRLALSFQAQETELPIAK